MHFKWLKCLLSAIAAGTVLATSVPVYADAKSVEVDLEDFYRLTVSLIDMNANPCVGYSQYPYNPRIDDLVLELKTASGEVITSYCSINNGVRDYTFELADKSELDTFTITPVTQGAFINTGISDAVYSYRLYDAGTATWVDTPLSFEYGDTKSTYFPTKDNPTNDKMKYSVEGFVTLKQISK